MRTDFDILGESAVYPGHPITLAYLITQNYDSLAAVLAPCYDNYGYKQTWCAAVGDSRIPGAGGNVHAAVDLLKNLVAGNENEALTRALYLWKSHTDNCYEKYKVPGQEQANRVLPLLLETLKTWK